MLEPAELRQRMLDVQQRIETASARARRDPAGINLIAVTKKFPADVILRAYELGLRQFGENYVQEFASKQPQLAGLSEARFHLIGHLQANKTGRAVQLFHCIQTVDSARIAKRLHDGGRQMEILLEVKLSPEQAKTGSDPSALPGLIEAVRACSNLRLTGLMTMPPWSENPEHSRPYFQRLRDLAARHELPHLSMGMSHDFEVAIEEGATHVRVGTALFGPRKKP